MPHANEFAPTNYQRPFFVGPNSFGHVGSWRRRVRMNSHLRRLGFRCDQEIETPNSLPTAKVTAAARLPSNSIRAPENTAARPVNSDSVAPTANSAIAVNSPAIGSARAP